MEALSNVCGLPLFYSTAIMGHCGIPLWQRQSAEHLSSAQHCLQVENAAVDADIRKFWRTLFHSRLPMASTMHVLLDVLTLCLNSSAIGLRSSNCRQLGSFVRGT